MASKNKPALIVSAMGWAMQMVLLIVEILREVGWSDEEIHTLGTKRGYEDLKRGVRAFADALKKSATFTLSTTEPAWPGNWTKKNGWKAVHRPLAEGEITVTFRDGEMYLNGVNAIEHLSPEQKRSGVIVGEALEKHLETMPNLPDVLLDLLIREQDNEEVAKFLARFEGRYPFFWGTIYEAPDGRRFVRFFRWFEGRADWGLLWLGGDWFRIFPALVLAHPLGS